MHINYLIEFKHNKTGLVGLILITLIIMAALGGPALSPHAPGGHSVNTLAAPSSEHWLGTNDVGQDIFSRLLAGARTSLLVAIGTAFFSTLLAVLVGLTAALAGGMADAFLMRFTDALLTIPVVIMVVMVAAYVQPGIFSLIVILSLLGWSPGARVIRSQALTLKESVHVYAARSFGGGTVHIALCHIIPDLFPILCVGFIQGARRAVFMEAGLAFLGIAAMDTVSWGLMLRHALEFCYLDAYKWWLLPTGFALSITILAFTLMGYCLEEIFDPRLRGHENA